MNKEILKPDGQRYTYLDLVVAPPEVLESIMKQGKSPDVRSLVGSEFKGYNTLDLTQILGFRKFKKGFYADRPPETPNERIKGYNVRVVQNGLKDPWIPVMKKGHPIRHGFYDCYPVDPGEPDNLYPNALLINYACGRNFKLDPANLLRDYLVQVYPDNPDLLLGKAYIALGPLRKPVSFFVLERYNTREPDAKLP